MTAWFSARAARGQKAVGNLPPGFSPERSEGENTPVTRRLWRVAVEALVGTLCSLPVQREFFVRRGAISQIKIDKCLIRDADLQSEFLKVADGAFVHPESYLTFKSAGIRILNGFCKIVFFSHLLHLSQ